LLVLKYDPKLCYYYNHAELTKNLKHKNLYS